MSEVLIEYDTVLTAQDGGRWVARACGRPRSDRMWEGWIEFIPLDAASRPLRSRRESTQPSRESLAYWATGLTPIYLTGSLDRTLTGPLPSRRVPRTVAPLFDGPAPEEPPPPPPAGPHPILDPFDVYAQGDEDLLLRQLEALDTPRLRDIVVAYEIGGARDPLAASREQLVTAIVAAARAATTKV
jgi:hypothetical protein